MSKERSLEERVSLFNTLQLPGQPLMMHMGTCSLVSDLMSEVRLLMSEVHRLNAIIDELEE